MARKKDAVKTTMTQDELNNQIAPILQGKGFRYVGDNTWHAGLGFGWFGGGTFIIANIVGGICYLEGFVRGSFGAENDFSLLKQLWYGVAPIHNALGFAVYREVLASIR